MANNDNNNVNNNSGNQTPHFDNLKAKLASKAATAVGGPAAGKAVDTLNKIRNNPNNNGYANNKRNRLGQAGNTSNDNSSGLDENSSNGTTNTSNNSSNSPINKLGSMLGGNSNKINENDSTVTKAVKTVKKIKMIAPIIAALSPLIMSFLGLIIIVVIVMSQFAAIENFVAEIKVGVEKMLNFTSGDGWVTNETAFFTRLKDENAKYQELSNNNENLDLPLIAATIHYDRLVDIDVYEEDQIKNEEYKATAQDSAIVKKENTAAFYGVAEKMLGKVDTVVPGDRMLLGHLVKTKIKYVEFDDNNALDAWGNYFKQAGISISKELCYPNPVDIKCYAKQSSEFVKNITNFKEKYDDILAYDDFKRLNIAYEIEEFLSGFSTDEELKEEQKQSGNWVPVVTREMDYETYKNYLRKVYIPYNYYFGAKKEDVDPLEVEKIVEEIFAQRDYYNYLFHSKTEDSIANCELADVGEWVNWKQGGSSWSGIVIGHYKDKNGKVHSSTVGGIGCFITSYSIQMARTGLFGSDFNPGIFANKTLQTSCYSYGGGFRGGACFKNAFPAVSKVEGKTYSGNNLQEMASKMKDDIVNNNCYLTLRVKYGKNKNGDEQQHWVAVAGIDNSNNILIVDPAGTKEKGIHVLDNKYCSKAGYNVCKQTSVSARCMLFDGVSGVNITSDKTESLDKTKSSGDWENWRQFDDDWGKVEIVKGHPELSLTKQGCLLTSYAIQMARSGTVSKDFNPGNFTTTLRDNGAFGGSKDIIDPDILKNKYPQVSDSYSKTYTYNGLNDLGKQIKTDINNGCYVTLQSKYNSDHFIAVVDVDSNNNITIVDPASGKSGKTTLNANYCKDRNQHICDRTSVNAYCLKINGGNSDNSLSKCSYSYKKSSGATCNGKFCFPLPYPTYNKQGWYYGRNGHDGSDFAAPQGTNVYAYKAGIVEKISHVDNGQIGVYVILKHDCSDGTACYTRYGHMVENSNSHLKVGDKVEAGAVIGKVGETGVAIGNHLHFDVWKNSNSDSHYDPARELVDVAGFTIQNDVTKPKSTTSTTSPTPSPTPSPNKSSGAKCISNYCFPVKYGTRISSPYGPRGGRTHKGIDLAAGSGTNIYAYKTGKVVKIVYTGYGGGYGTHLILQHDCNDGKACYSLYAHMISNSNKKLKKGDTVQAGTIIGKVGNTGHSFGAHLHFEMWKKYSYDAHYNPASELQSIGFSLKY